MRNFTRISTFAIFAIGSLLLWGCGNKSQPAENYSGAPAESPATRMEKPIASAEQPEVRTGGELNRAEFSDAPHTATPLAPQGKEQEEENDIPLRTRMDLAMQQEFNRTVDPALGRVPRERLYEAWKYTQSLGENSDAAIAGVNWTERGPSNVSGRSRAMVVDPNDVSGNTVFVGSVSGGLWKTTDITANPPVWTAVDEFMGNLAITSIAVDPSNTSIWYLTTGEAYSNLDAVRGDGVWKSTNGGTTWTQLASTTGAAFDFCTKVVVTSTGVVLVATANSTGGLQRSTDGGTTWAKRLGTGLSITGAASNTCWDIEIAANGDVYAALEGSIHKSVNGGLNFAAAMTTPITTSRVDLACAPSDLNYVYALVEFGNTVNGILRTTDGGTNWTSRTEPADADPGCPAADFSNGQGWYNLAIAVDPNNRDVLMVGGLDIFKSTDGAGTWSQIAHWYGGFGFQYVHADQHFIYYLPGSSTVAYFGNDGGIYRTTNANGATPTITFKGDNYNVTQFYACALHPTAFSDYALAGAQDNGTHQFTGAGINSTSEVTGGDGAFCHIDQDQPQFQFTQYIFNDFYRSTDNGNTWTNITSSGGQFINPSDYDNSGNRMYSARNAGQYLRWDDPQTGGTFTTINVAGFGAGIVNAVTVSPNTANRVFFGLDNGTVFRVDNANTGAPTATSISTGLPAGADVSCIEVETGNDNHLLVTFSNYGVNSVWESVNGGTSWTSVEGNLPDMPIRWALFNPNNTDQAMLATELGVWTTDNLNGGATNWGTSNTGLANVRVDMLQMRQSDKFVIAATHGRGLYSTDIFTAPTALFSATPLLTYTGKTVTFTDQSYNATSWSWNFGDGNTSTLRNPTHVYTTAGKFDITLTINGGGSTLIKTGYIHVLPDRGTPYVVATDGSTFEINPNDFGSQAVLGGIDKWERGVPTNFLTTVNSPTNVWKTDLDADLTSGNYECVLQSPSYNFTSSASAYTLRFRRSMEIAFCNGPFAVQVQYSTDKGDTWTRLGVNADPNATNWYNRGPASACPVDAGIFADRYGWTLTTNNTLVTYNLTTGVPALVGQSSVAFRIILSVRSGYSAAGYTVDGFMVDDFEILGPTNAAGLPATYSPLTGKWKDADVQLSWDSYSENNVRGYNVLRSADGISFTQVGFVPGSVNSTAEINYGWLDEGPAGDVIWYQLEQEDLDGNVSYSNIVEMRRSESEVPVLTVAPNPYSTEFTASISTSLPGEIQAFVLDMSGRIVKQKTFEAGTTAFEFSGEGMAPGVYFLELRSGQQVVRTRIVQQ